MVNIQIENSPISIQLNETESVTVPTGEVWKVTVTGRSASVARDEDSGYAHIERYCKINGTIVASSESKSEAWHKYDMGNATANASSTFPSSLLSSRLNSELIPLIRLITVDQNQSKFCASGR